MTNGEKIQTILDVDRDCTEVHGDNGTMTFTVTSDFWNEEYKEPNKSENPTDSTTDAPENNVGSIEPTTKNDLGIDCISRADVNLIICEYRDDAAETGSERALERAYGANAVGALISELPSVTQIRPKGHWREVDTNMYACSECSHVLAIDPLVNSILEINTCPFCSVKMKGVIENERKID